MKRLTVTLSVLFLAALAAVFLLCRGVGEWQPATALMLYLPQQIWLAPLLVLLPLCLRHSPRWAAAHGIAALLFLWLHMDFRWSLQAASAPKEQLLTVMTNNRGEDNKQSFAGFVEAESPDLMVLQEDGRADLLRQDFPGYETQNQGKFTLASRFPIKGSGIVKLQNAVGPPVVAWFEIEYRGAPLVIYNVHMPSPRRDLASLRLRGLAAGVVGWGSLPLAGRRREEQAKWLARIRLAEEFEALLAAEKRPYILAGDFNMPPWGWLYRLFHRRHTDAFAAAGRGWGLSFPGDTRNPLSLFEPWLRLDYVFCSAALRPVYAKVEPARRSQHRCVLAKFELRTGS